MLLQMKRYRLTSLLLTLVLLVGVACSSDDDSNDEGGILPGNSSFTMKLDGQSWSADEVHIITMGGPEWWGEEDDELYFVTISATKYLDGNIDSENAEVFGITIVVPKDKFTNPKDIYTAPPPDAMNEAGYSWGNFISSTNNTTLISIDPTDEFRNVGNTQITGFEIGNSSILGEGYVSLSGTFEYELFGYDVNTEGRISREATEGHFNITKLF